MQSKTAVQRNLHLAGHGLIGPLDPEGLDRPSDERRDDASPPFVVDLVGVHAIEACVHEFGSPIGQRLDAGIEIHISEAHLIHDYSLVESDLKELGGQAMVPLSEWFGLKPISCQLARR